MNLKFEELIEGFLKDRVGICEDFLSPDLAKSLQQNLLDLEEKEKLMHAATGYGPTRSYDINVRGDKIHWLDRVNNQPTEIVFLGIVESFIDYLNKTCYTGINDYEFHYALYEPGRHYQRHRDQFKNNSGRKYSLVCYLNDDWKETDGGALLLYKNEEVTSIMPTIGKAVFFQSDEMEHEVAMAGKQRMSIAGWLKRI